MALDFEINEEKFNGLSDGLKGEYKKDDTTGKYKLDVSGMEDTGALRRAHDRTKQELNDARRERDEASNKLKSLGDDAARKAGDIATLEKSWKEKSDAEIGARDAKIAKYESAAKYASVNASATEIAAKLTDSPAVLMPHIKSRLTAEIDPETGSAKLRVLDANGQPSALTADDLVKEFSANKDFSAIIRANKSSGAGGNQGGGKQGSGSGGFRNQQDAPSLATMPVGELTERIKAKLGH